MAHEADDNDGIAPRLTMAEVHELNGVVLEDGRQFFPALPALKANSLQGKQDHPQFCQECRESPFLDREGHDKNRQLAEIIKKAVKDLNIDFGHYVHRQRPMGELLPWDHVNVKKGRAYLEKEQERSLVQLTVMAETSAPATGCGATRFRPSGF